MVANRNLMSRRQFVSNLLIGGITGSGVVLSSFGILEVYASPTADDKSRLNSNSNPTPPPPPPPPQAAMLDHHVKDAVSKAKDFERDYASDIFLTKRQSIILHSILKRLTRLQRLVGYANFNLIGFDAALLYARRYSVVGRFTKREMALIEALFVFDATHYGFLGKKVSEKLTDKINLTDVKKIAGSGHYLYRGDALVAYQKLRTSLGGSLILTSGIRSVVKQLHLFIAKTDRCGGNLSRAARSLAPPGHSFHGVGDFDVGQKGLGAANFSDAFMATTVYHRLTDLGLVSERYPKLNPYGVRHEPWHIKVVKNV